MELGEKLRQARLEAGLTQRQLCGDEITRNMLSLIEHGTAKPSMGTLQYLAGRLGKSVSYFLEETVVLSPNQERMVSVRMLYDAGEFPQAAELLEEYQAPDPIFDREKQLLQVLILLELAKRAIVENRKIYARELLEKADTETVYCAEDLKRRKNLLLGQLGESVATDLPSLDGELLLRAGEAFREGKHNRAACLLEAMEQRTCQWNLLRGDVYLVQEKYREAAGCFHQAETEYPAETAPKLERCYRELEDYKRAYEYACKQK